MPVLIEGVSNSVLASSVVIGAVFAGFTYHFYRYVKNKMYPTISVEDLINAQNEPPPAHNRHMCPICRCPPTFAVETSCAHLYCGQCLKTCYERKPIGSPLGLLCPLCRQEITLLFICFSQEERYNEEFEAERNPLCTFIWNYNASLNEGRTFFSTLRDVPLLLRRLARELFDNNVDVYHLRYRIYVVAFFLIVYVIVPLDILPESAFGIVGLTDDLLVMGFLSIYISSLYRQHLAGPH